MHFMFHAVWIETLIRDHTSLAKSNQTHLKFLFEKAFLKDFLWITNLFTYISWRHAYSVYKNVFVSLM